MRYEQIAPPEFLKDHIRYFWILESEDSDDPHELSYTFTTIADGGPGLLFQHPDKGVYYQFDKLLPALFLYGQATGHAALKLMGKFRTLGVHFLPHALKSVFGLDAGQLTDTCLDLELFAARDGYRLKEQLSGNITIAEKVGLLSSYLFFLARKNNVFSDSTMDYALSEIMQSGGSISLRELQQKLRLSERSIERKFKQTIGLSPKLFSRICRFQASLNQLHQSSYDKLSDIAYEQEYADQSHLIRSFKEFAGVSPFRYQKQSQAAAGEGMPRLNTNDPLVGFVLFYGLQRS